MLVYEKKVNGEQKLFGTMGNIPAENDVQLTYKDETGAVITPIAKDTYRDNSKEGVQGIIRESDKKAVNVFIGDKCIIGKVATVNSAAPKTEPQVSKVEPKVVKEEPKAVVKEAVKEEVKKDIHETLKKDDVVTKADVMRETIAEEEEE